MVTTASAASPAVAVMPPGREPKESSTFSPSSSTESSVAANVMVFSVSAAPKVRESGTPV